MKQANLVANQEISKLLFSTQLKINPLTSKRRTFESSNLLHRFSPQTVIHPITESEIIQILQIAASQNLTVRTIGSLHSYAPIFSTEGICIVLDQYNRLIDVEDNLVTVEAGMTISELNELLAKYNLALPIVGAIDKQTVSGAISTGTHGGSVHHRSLSGYVDSLRLIRADGSVLDIHSSQEIFNAVAVSMGLLGIISTVTFRCVQAFTLQGQSKSILLDTLVKQFDTLHQSNEYIDIKYLPITDNVQVLTINRAVASKYTDVSEVIHRSPLERKIKTLILKGMLSLFQHSQFNWLQYLLVKHHQDNIYPAYQVNRSDLLLTNLDQTYYDPIPLHNMEVAIPYTQAPAVLKVLGNHFRKTRRYPNIFIRIRCSAADNFWLSPAYQQTTCWLDFCEYPYTGNFFQEIAELLKPFNIRCHWGKEIQIERDYLKQRYQKWDEFLRLRQAWDSQGIFANKCLDDFFLTGSKKCYEGRINNILACNQEVIL